MQVHSRFSTHFPLGLSKHTTDSVWRLEVDRFMSNHNGVRTFHLDSEPSGREHLFPQDLSWLLHAGKRLGTAFDHPGLIAARTIGIAISGQITQHPWVAQQPRHQFDAMPEPSAPQPEAHHADLKLNCSSRASLTWAASNMTVRMRL